MAKVGAKPRLLQPVIRKRLTDAIRAGATYALACKYAGVGERTFYDAMARARAGDPDYAPLLTEVEDAEGAGAVAALAVIRKAAAAGQWQAAAWLLERRYRKSYGRDSEEQRPVSEGPETEGDISPTTPEGRKALLDELAKLPPDVLDQAREMQRAG